MDKGTESVVYFAKSKRTGHIKIGYTTNPDHRFPQLANHTALGDNIVIMGIIEGGGPKTEQALHTVFSEQRVGNTEWFECTPELESLIDRRATPWNGQSSFDTFRTKFTNSKTLSISQAAHELGIEPDSVRKLIYRELITAHKLGREWYILRRDLEAYREERRPPGRPPGSSSQ